MIDTRRQAEVYQHKRVMTPTKPSSARTYVSLCYNPSSPRHSLILPLCSRSSSQDLSSSSSPSHSLLSYFFSSSTACVQTNLKHGLRTKCTVSLGNATGVHSSAPCSSVASVSSYVLITTISSPRISLANHSSFPSSCIVVMIGPFSLPLHRTLRRLHRPPHHHRMVLLGIRLRPPLLRPSHLHPLLSWILHPP